MLEQPSTVTTAAMAETLGLTVQALVRALLAQRADKEVKVRPAEPEVQQLHRLERLNLPEEQEVTPATTVVVAVVELRDRTVLVEAAASVTARAASTQQAVAAVRMVDPMDKTVEPVSAVTAATIV